MSTEIIPEPPEIILLPPTPPLHDFTPGEFEYVTCENTKRMLQTAYKAINFTETWDYIKQDCDSFMMSTDSQLYAIYHKIEDIGYSCHSGVSFGITMRYMQFIAKHGEKQFKETYFTD